MRYEMDIIAAESHEDQPPSEAINMLAREAIFQTGTPELINDSIIEIREIPGTDNFYNAAAWEYNGITHLLGRQVEAAGGYGEPDVGSLVLKTLGQDGNISTSKEVWKPNEGGELLLEDARALPLSDGRIAFGITAVDRNKTPHPAVLIIATEELTNGTLPEPKIIEILGNGDQTTPLGEDTSELAGKNVTAIDSNLFAFRPEGDNNNHQLRVIQYREDGTVSHQQYINFPKDIAWAEWRIGTTMPPIWLNDHEAIFPIHGINKVADKYVYSIGSARLLKDENGILSVDNIISESLINPDLFADMYDGNDVELHSERRVVYCCGGIPVKDANGELERLKLYVNVGDRRTVEVTVPIAALTKGWISHPTAEQPLSQVA